MAFNIALLLLCILAGFSLMRCSRSLNSGLYLCGHSAGAHLAAMVLSTDWSEYSVSPQIKGVFGDLRNDDGCDGLQPGLLN